MTSFHITWRPSGGRGEYEYTPIDGLYENKLIVLLVKVDGLERRIVTDTHLEKNGGKRRLRRSKPTDRTQLSVPNLVVALAALPKPTRDRDNIAVPELAPGRWAVGDAEFEVISALNDAELVVSPVSLLPRHFKNPILVNSRMDAIVAEAKTTGSLAAQASNHLKLIGAGAKGSSLEKSAEQVFIAFGDQYADIPALASPDDIATVLALQKADDTALPVHSASEGKKRVVAHVLRERNRQLVKSKKDAFRVEKGVIFCEGCGLEPIAMYGHPLDGLIEVHHKVPLNECVDDEIRVTSLDDLALLCRNCHGAAHRISPMPKVDELKDLLLMRPQAI